MNRKTSAHPASLILGAFVLFASLFFWACEDSSTNGSNEPFAVKFTVASVPRGLTLDSIEIHISLGDTGSPQNFVIDTKTGVSKAKVQAFPGQKYELTYKFFSGGYEIGKGLLTGVLDQDMSIALAPEWDMTRVDLAYVAIHSGKYLPPYLEATFNLALAGKPLVLQIDSTAGKSYRWFVRLGDSVIAEGVGSKITWTPADSLANQKINLKIQVLDKNTIVEEKKWDIQIISATTGKRLQSIVTKNDSNSNQGSLTYFKYNAAGNKDSVLILDTTVFLKGKTPVATISYAYTTVTGKQYVQKATSTFKNDTGKDSVFTYDNQGRLTSIAVTLQSGTTIDSLSYGTNGAVETRSFAQGKLVQILKHERLANGEEVDSSFSVTESVKQISRMIRYLWKDNQLVSSKTYVNKDGLTPNTSERYIYNAMGALAIRLSYTESGTLELLKSETFTFNAAGLLAKIVSKDEASGEVQSVQTFEFVATSSPVAKISVAQLENRQWIFKLSQPSQLSGTPKTSGASTSTQQFSGSMPLTLLKLLP
jgi:YD repeat-containing protein